MKVVCNSCKYAKKNKDTFYCVKYGTFIWSPRFYCVAFEGEKNEQVREQDNGT